MNIKIWGCRGSIPSPGREKQIFGGNTSCVEITHEDTCIVLDGGTGIQKFGENLNPDIRTVNILLTHLHMDHILGLGFFAPLYDPEMTVNVWGPAAASSSLRDRLRRYFSPPLFPIRLNDIPCKGDIFEIDNSTFSIGSIKVTSSYVCHPGPTVGYRLEAGNTVIVYIPDHEPILGSSHYPHIPEWTSGYSLAEGADILFHDAQFELEQYHKKIGWGHSAMKDTIDFAILAGVKKLVLFHHDPNHTDQKLQKMYDQSLKEIDANIEIEIAKEGKTYTLDVISDGGK